MKYVSAFIFKWILAAAVLLIVYSAIYNADMGRVFLMSIIFTVVSFLGDLFILPRVKNSTETVLDLVLTFLILWAVGAWLFAAEIPLIVPAIISSIVIGVGEWFLHSYMKRSIYHQGDQGPTHA